MVMTEAATRQIGVLLVNLGTPEAPTSDAVRRYLREFLTDSRVIENQDSAIWRLILNGYILPFRPKVKAKAYASIWNREADESPLKTITRAQAAKLASALTPDHPAILVDWAMRYGLPSIPERLQALVARGCDRVLVVPLYPQYSATTTATVADKVFRTLMRMRAQPALRIARPYYDDPVYIDALAESVKTALARLPEPPEMIIASYHGVPQVYVDKGDPYAEHCAETTRLLRARLGYGEDKLIMTFQSRFGRSAWLRPYTDKTLESLARKRIKRVAMVMPGFAADCLETLEEIAIEGAHHFKSYGGEQFTVVPCLNDSAGGIAALSSVAARELKGWV
jgi:protoporphyrin/coproporphyrin ferrochelatase